MDDTIYLILYNPGKHWYVYIRDDGRQAMTEAEVQEELEAMIKKKRNFGIIKVVNVCTSENDSN